jgi:hypothetical protein
MKNRDRCHLSVPVTREDVLDIVFRGDEETRIADIECGSDQAPATRFIVREQWAGMPRGVRERAVVRGEVPHVRIGLPSQRRKCGVLHLLA